jgi:hypothetical protein
MAFPPPSRREEYGGELLFGIFSSDGEVDSSMTKIRGFPRREVDSA